MPHPSLTKFNKVETYGNTWCKKKQIITMNVSISLLMDFNEEFPLTSQRIIAHNFPMSTIDFF